MEVIEHIDPPRLAALERASSARAAPCTVIVTTPERRVQRPLRDAAAGRAAPPRPPLRVDPRAVPRLGRRGGGRATATACGSCRSGRTTRRSARRPRWRSSTRSRREPAPADRPGGGAMTELGVPELSLVVLDRRQRLGQVDVRARAVHADRGDLVRLLPRPGGRRRERPVRDRRRVRAAALHRRQAAGRGPADRRGRDQRAARGAPRSWSRWPASTTCCRWRSCSTCRRASAARGTRAARTATSATT